MKPVLISILLLFYFQLQSQTTRIYGIVQDARTQEPLAGASLTYYISSGVFGGISNSEGRFSINQAEKPDSLKISMIGYQSRLIPKDELNLSSLSVTLEPQSAALHAVIVHPIDPADLVRQAIQKIPSSIPAADFESRGFYREVIRDTANYYSVAEAIFKIQMQIKKKTFRLSPEKGRSKEDVTYSRLFEDYHAGGGPEDAVGQSLVLHRPGFLDAGKMQDYVYKKDSTIQRDDETIYIISFDQKPGIHEALEKGLIYINAEDLTILRFEARNSPLGTRYIKSLSGSDKLFAEILHIDLRVLGWNRSVSFEKIGDKLFLSYAKMQYHIDYKQPKKGLDLHLNIQTELVITDFQHPVTKEITGIEEWKRKNLVANLPADFDRNFWGSESIMDPTAEVNQIINAIGRKNNDSPDGSEPEGWSYLNKSLFVVYGRADSMSLVPLSKCSWDDEESGPMIYKNISGDFLMEVKLSVCSRSKADGEPDNGFQQGGIIIRDAKGMGRNNLILAMGTGGSSTPKYFLKKSENGKTKTLVDKTQMMNGWLRMEKRENQITVYKKPDEHSSWEKWNVYEMDWVKGELEVGFMVTAHFAGDGPKQRPDIKAVFTNIKMISP